jgi:hypothetical protein
MIIWTALAIAFSGTATAQKKDVKKISRPPKGISWQVKDKEANVVYNIIPVENIDPKDHAKCRELIKEEKSGFMFFVVIIDNKRGTEPVKFNAFGGDAHFYYYPPKNPKKPKDPPPEPKKYGFVSLRNYFAEDHGVADKASYKKIKGYFKTKLTVPAGGIGWSLCCIRDAFIFDVSRSKVTWAIPGALPVNMKVKRYSRSLLKKANIDLFDDKKK